MKRALIVLGIIVAALAGVGIGIAAARYGASGKAIAHASSNSPAGAIGATASSNDESTGAARGDDPNVIWFASNPMPIPPFMVRDLNGGLVSTASLKGKVVLLSFWATWCGPCREELPELVRLANRYKDRLQIIGISLDDSPPADVRAFAAHAGINYPVVMGSAAMTSEYGGVPALPTNFLADQQGHIVQKHVGLYPESTYDEEIRALLGMPVNATVKRFEDTGQIFLKNAARATELPGVDLAKLSPDQKKAALKELNSRDCSCGCRMTLAECRINDSTCPISKEMAGKIVKQIAAHGGTPRPAAAVQR